MTAGCASSLTGYGALAARLRAKAARDRTPLEGSIELTARCNLACRHCYINQPAIVGDAPVELDAGQLTAILDQLAGAGCLWLGITGGEPLAHPAFAAIYRHARERGFLVTLLTNGTLIDERVAALLAELPPLMVEVTLYGHTASTYERVTGVAGSFARCRAGIERLAAGGVPYRLKTTLTAANRHELDAMREDARARDVEFRADGLLSRRLDGRPLPADIALAPSELVALELAEQRTRAAWQERVVQRRASAGSPDSCAAGVSAFHVDYRGSLMPCVMAREPAWSLLDGSFQQGWNGTIREAIEAWVGSDSPCRACALAVCCDACPGWGLLEHGDAARPVELLCRVAAERAQALGIAGAPGSSAA